MVNNLPQKIVLSLAFTAIVYLGLTLYADAPKLAHALLNWDWRWFSFALLAVLGNYLLRFARWHYYLRVIGITNVPPPPSLLIFLSGFALTMVPGKLGELIKSFLLKSHYGVSVSYSASIVAAERLSDVLGMTLLVAIGIAIFPAGVPALALLLTLLVAALALMQSRALAEFILQKLETLPLVGKFAQLARNLYAGAYLLLQLKPLLISFALSVVAWFAECGAFYFVVLGFALPPDGALLLQATFIYALASLFGAATFLPGGVGVTEGSMTSLVQLLIGASAPIAAAATLLTRLATLWFAVVLGIVALVVFGKLEPNALLLQND